MNSSLPRSPDRRVRPLLLRMCLTGALASLAASSAADASEGGAAPSPPTLGAAPVDAAPHARPLLPQDVDDPRAGEDERLQRRLTERVRALDGRIATMVDERGGERPPPASDDAAALAEPRRRRDDAYSAFRRALQDRVARGSGPSRDTLDAATPQAKERVRVPLAAVNQLAIAECYKDLASAPEGDDDDLGRGQRALDAVDAAGLAESELPRLYYMRAWFLAEVARRAPPEERSAKADAARAAAKDLARAYPLSELARAAQALTIDLGSDPPGPGAATRAP